MKAYLTAAMAGLAAMTFASGAQAADRAGKVQVKGMITSVDPDGKIEKVNTSTLALPANTGTKASTNVVPTLAAEYFVNDSVSVETICCLTSHHVTGTGGIQGADVVDHVQILPATLTVKAHADLGGFKPYIGAGPSLFLIFGEKPGATMRTAYKADKVKMSNKLGFALQTGFDVPIDEQFGVTVDAKKYFNSTTAKFYSGDKLILSTEHKLDPWVIGGGVYYRF